MSSMAQWSVLSFLFLQQQQDISKKGTATKPFEVTFQTPSHIQEHGLSTITITIPPASLERLNNSIAEHLPKQQQQQQQHYQVSADRTNPYNDGTLPTTTLPTLRAIQYFMYDCFHFDITSFPLTRVSCNDIGIIGCDGRIKLFSLTFVDTILKGIQDMVVERYGDANDVE
jgi:Kinetochore complex Sim4 subunit Fta1